jgi:TonB family protein
MANYTILLIDYEPRSIERFREPLIAAGYTIEIATDGVSGIEAFHRLNPDMVLVEAMIPKKHGFEVCQELKRTPHGRRTPVLITTGVYKGRKYRTQALHIYGCDEYIEKPIAPEQLLKVVGRFLGPSASAPPPKATEPVAATPDTDAEPRAHRNHGSTQQPVTSAEPAAPPESQRTRLTSVPQRTVAKDGAEDEIIARLDAILPGGRNATQRITERETVTVVEPTEDDPFAQMRAELNAELGSLSAALAFEPTLGPSDQAVSPSVLEALPVPEAEILIAPPAPPPPVVADERSGQVVDFVAKRSRKNHKNKKTERQSNPRPPQVARVAPPPEPVELTLPPGTLVAAELEPNTGRSGMPTWIWAALGLVAIVTVYFVFGRSGSNGDDAVPSQPAPTESAAIAPPVANEPPAAIEPPPVSAPPMASEPSKIISTVPMPAQNVADSSKPVHNALAVPAPKKTPDHLAKAPVASVIAPKPPVVPPAAVETARSEPPRIELKTGSKIEAVKETPQELPPPSALDDSVEGVETVPDVAPSAPATSIAPGTLIPIDEADTTPVSLTHQIPAYPAQARRLRLSGPVLMNVLVNDNGTVDQVVLVSGVPGADLNDAAMHAVRSWTYRPATKNGVPVKVWKSERIVFKL